MTNILITGGAGFIGSHLVRALLQRGDSVRVLDNFSTGRRENLAGLRGDLKIIEGDLRDPLKVAEAVRSVDIIFHEAAFVSVPQSMQEPLTCLDINVNGTATLLEAARQAGVRRVVLASSAAVYGEAQAFPLTENISAPLLSPYAASKRTDEIYADFYTHALGLPVVALRYFNVYGPRQRPDSPYAAAIPIFARRMLARQPVTIFGDGGQSRDFVYVGDVVRANLMAAEAPQAPGRTFNICTGTEISLLDLLATLHNLLPDAPSAQFADPRPGDIYRSLGSPALAAQVLGFHAQVTLAEGLHQTIEWMKHETPHLPA
ncbi:MAG: SDR family oxidoreductase [Anaerolineales bacterium]